jgi:N-acetylmuramoyl-L-alanine amidase
MKTISTSLVCVLAGLCALRLSAFETVVVDPGHGGNDEGTKWYKVAEKDLSLAVAQRLSGLLRAKGLHVVQTRKDDRYVSLDDRAAIANQTRNSLLVSIHFNASDCPTAAGFQTYHFFASPSGQVIARSIQGALGERIISRNRGVYKKDFAVLARTNDLAVLIECGFISNKTEALYYATPDGQDALASAIAAGIMRAKPVINNDPPECEEAKCTLFAMKAAAAQRKLALGGRAEREDDDLHGLDDPRNHLVAMVTPVQNILAEIEFRYTYAYGGG